MAVGWILQLVMCPEIHDAVVLERAKNTERLFVFFVSIIVLWIAQKLVIIIILSSYWKSKTKDLESGTIVSRSHWTLELSIRSQESESGIISFIVIPQSFINSTGYTSIKNVSVKFLSCCLLPISYDLLIICKGNCKEYYHGRCMDSNFNDNCLPKMQKMNWENNDTVQHGEVITTLILSSHWIILLISVITMHCEDMNESRTS